MKCLSFVTGLPCVFLFRGGTTRRGYPAGPTDRCLAVTPVPLVCMWVTGSPTPICHFPFFPSPFPSPCKPLRNTSTQPNTRFGHNQPATKTKQGVQKPNKRQYTIQIERHFQLGVLVLCFSNFSGSCPVLPNCKSRSFQIGKLEASPTPLALDLPLLNDTFCFFSLQLVDVPFGVF